MEWGDGDEEKKEIERVERVNERTSVWKEWCGNG